MLFVCDLVWWGWVVAVDVVVGIAVGVLLGDRFLVQEEGFLFEWGLVELEVVLEAADGGHYHGAVEVVLLRVEVVGVWDHAEEVWVLRVGSAVQGVNATASTLPTRSCLGSM